jgi:transposase-like protein
MAKRGGKHHSAEQGVKKLRDAEAMLASGKTIGEACQTIEVSEHTYFRWKRKYGGMKAEEAKRLEELEQENGRLKKLVADLSLDVQMLKEIARGNF